MTEKKPLPFSFLLLAGWLALMPAAVFAQSAAAAAETEGDGDFRDTSGYPFSAVSQVTAELQNVAYAMQLRDYCADRGVKDAFVRERLKRFSRLTGRRETCRTLLNY